MRTYLFFVLLLAGAFNIYPQPVFQLLFNGGVVNGNGVDSSGNAFAGHHAGDSIYNATIQIEGTSCLQGGDNDNWESKGNYTFGDRKFTFVTNFYITSLYGGYRTLLANKEGDGSYGIDIQLDETNMRIYGRSSAAGGTNDFYSANSIWSHDTWYHLAVIVDSTIIRIYLDNVKLTLLDSVVRSDWFTGPDTLGVGGFTGAVQSRELYTNGFMDNTQLYDTVLTAIYIDSLYQRKATNFKLTGGGIEGGGDEEGYFPPTGYLIPYRDGVKRKPSKDGITLYFKKGVISPPAGGDTIDYFYYDDFETWESSDVNTLAGIMNKWQINGGNFLVANQSIVDVGGVHDNVWRAIVYEDTWSSMEFNPSLGDTASDVWMDYDFYADPDFNHMGKGGAYSGKMLFGFESGNDITHSDSYDTTATSGRGGWIHEVWGSGGAMMGYRRDQVYNFYACGACGTIPIPKGYWIHLTHHLKINDLGYTNGFYEVYVDGVLTIKVTGLRFRSVTQGEDYGKIEKMVMDYFFGGEETYAYASPRDQYVQFDNLVVYKYKTGATSHRVEGRNIGNIGSQISPPGTTHVPDALLYNETYFNASDTIYDVGNNKSYIYWPPFTYDTIVKYVEISSGQVDFTFLTEEFGYPDYGISCEYWVKVYQVVGEVETLIYQFGRTGINNGRTSPYTNPTGNYTINSTKAKFEIHPGCNGGITRGVAIRYW